MIPSSITKKVIDQTDIVEIISEYVQLKKKGTSYFGLCPFHDDKNPSMSVSGEKKIFNCFSCGTKGNVIYFVAKHENLTMEQATIKLAKRAGIKVEEHINVKDAKTARLLNVMKEAYNFYSFYLYNSEEGKVALQYLYSRGIDDEVIKEFKIGLAPRNIDYLHQALNKKEITTLDQIELGLVKDVNGKVHDIFRNRIMFSVTNPSGQIVGFSGRIYEKSDQAKYINSMETPLFHKGEVLYHFDKASLDARKLNQIYIFEGFMDVISVTKAGIKNAIATMGTAMTKEHLNIITRVTKNIVLFFDGDEAGLKALRRSTELLSQLKIVPNAVILPDGLDPDDYIKKYGVDAFNSYVDNNMKNAYLLLYNLAFQKVYLQDFNSVESFKNEIYQLIKLSNNEVIANYFIKQMADDLQLDQETLKDEFSKNVIQQSNYDYHETYKQEEPTQNKYKKKVVKITPSLIFAYNTIIKQSVNSRDLLSVFYENLSVDGHIRYPGKELAVQYDLLSFLCEFYSEHIYREGIGIDLFYESLKNKPASLKLAKMIMEDRFIDEKSEQLFNDSMNIISDYFKKLDNASLYNAMIYSKSLDEMKKTSDEFLKMSKEHKKIVNKEDI